MLHEITIEDSHSDRTRTHMSNHIENIIWLILMIRVTDVKSLNQLVEPFIYKINHDKIIQFD
jgi:hypothetical protein